MLLSESEAKTRWCPFSRVIVYDSATDRPVAGNRWQHEASGAIINSMCLGSGCMAWRWGLNWKPLGNIDPSDLTQPAMGIMQRATPTKGWCGLAGKPE